MTGSDTIRVLFAGGGTAGHLMPALNIAEEMVSIKANVRPMFVGKKAGIERDIVGRHGFPAEEIDVVPMRRTPLGILKFMLRWNAGGKQAAGLISEFNPVAVIGTGGYVCAPVVRAAHKMKKKIFLQEQNSLPGLALRSVARYAELIFLAYDSSARFFASEKCRQVGNPVRSDLRHRDREISKRKFGLDPSRKTLLILGGSSGSSSLNQAAAGHVARLIPEGWQILWQTGSRDFGRIYEKWSGSFNGAIFPFIDDMPSAYAASDLALSRAGAMALSEIIAVGLPSVLVPYPHATGDHQTLNALSLEIEGAAVIVPEANIDSRLGSVLTGLFVNDAQRDEMRKAALAVSKPDAARVIAETILERI